MKEFWTFFVSPTTAQILASLFCVNQRVLRENIQAAKIGKNVVLLRS